jgi:3-keto-disaccharide hydrolase
MIGRCRRSNGHEVRSRRSRHRSYANPRAEANRAGRRRGRSRFPAEVSVLGGRGCRHSATPGIGTGRSPDVASKSHAPGLRSADNPGHPAVQPRSHSYARIRFPIDHPNQIRGYDFKAGQLGFALSQTIHGRNLAIQPGDLLVEPVESVDGRQARRTINAERPVGSWNKAEIRIMGPTISYSLNGREVNRFEAIRDVVCEPGLHSNGTTIRFRNLWIRPLSNGAAPTKGGTGSRNP